MIRLIEAASHAELEIGYRGGGRLRLSQRGGEEAGGDRRARQDRLTLETDGEAQMILKIAAHARQIGDHLQPESPQRLGRTDARQHQKSFGD